MFEQLLKRRPRRRLSALPPRAVRALQLDLARRRLSNAEPVAQRLASDGGKRLLQPASASRESAAPLRNDSTDVESVPVRGHPEERELAVRRDREGRGGHVGPFEV